MITDKIEQYLKDSEKTIDESIRYEVEKMAGAVFKRQFMEDQTKSSEGKFWISSLGKCPRSLAYSYHGFEKAGKEIDNRAKMVFWMGDLVELTVVNLAKVSGVKITATGLNQMPIKMPVNGGFITGYPDGFVFHEKEIYLLEVKSMSTYAFKRFENGDIDDSYKVQINVELEALGLKKCVMVAICKDSGVMHEIIFEKDEDAVNKGRENVLKVLHSTKDNLPEQPKEYGPDEKGFYTWQCLYCSYWKHCRTNAEQVPVSGRYKLKEKDDGNRLSAKDGEGGGENRKSRSRVRKGKGDKLAVTGNA